MVRDSFLMDRGTSRKRKRVITERPVDREGPRSTRRHGTALRPTPDEPYALSRAAGGGRRVASRRRHVCRVELASGQRTLENHGMSEAKGRGQSRRPGLGDEEDPV